jgi:hypothetical protein
MSVRTIRSGGFQISSRTLMVAAALGALGALGCEAPPENGGAVEAISGGLITIVRNSSAADRVNGTTELVFNLSLLAPSTQGTTAFFSTLVASGTSFHPATAGASCTAGVDYIAVASRPISFPAGVTTATTSVTVCGDNLAEGGEDLFAKLVDASGQCEGELCLGIGRITDDPGVSIADLSVREPLSGAKTATLTLSLSQPVPRDVTVLATPVAGTATNTTSIGNISSCSSRLIDFMASPRAITIPAGATTATYDVTICGDNVSEPTQQFSVNLSSPLNAVLADAHATVSILDLTLGSIQLP